jgi:hypothetical protein
MRSFDRSAVLEAMGNIGDFVGGVGVLATLASIMLRRYENLILQTREGNLDPSLWSGLDWELRRMFSQPGTQAWWRDARPAFNQALQDYIDHEILSNAPGSGR